MLIEVKILYFIYCSINMKGNDFYSLSTHNRVKQPFFSLPAVNIELLKLHKEYYYT